MAVVTAIRQRGSKGDRYDVYLDGACSFTLSDVELASNGLRSGLEVSDEVVAHCRWLSDYNMAYKMALRFLTVRPRSRKEMIDYLKRKETRGEVLDEVLGRLVQLGLLDDKRFAEEWVRSRLLTKPRSRKMLFRELHTKGVSSGDIELALSLIEPEDELGALVGLIEKKRRSSRYTESEKIIGYFVRQGYSYSLIKRALASNDR